MKRKGQCSYSSEFKREAASLVISQGYGIVAAARAVGVSKSAISTWVRCLRQEQKGVIRSLRPLTEEGARIRELEQQLRRVQQENEILKKASALLMSDSLKNMR